MTFDLLIRAFAAMCLGGFGSLPRMAMTSSSTAAPMAAPMRVMSRMVGLTRPPPRWRRSPPR